MLCNYAREGNLCPYCYDGRRGKGYYRGHYGYSFAAVKRRKERECMPLQKPTSPLAGSSNAQEGTSDWPTLWPTLVEYLSQTTWDDGSPRETSTMLLFREDGSWKACLNDRAMGRTGWASSSSPEGTLQALEDALRDDRMEWRRKQSQGGGKRK